MTRIRRRISFRLVSPPDAGADRRSQRLTMSMVPSLFTIANIACGWGCVVLALRGEVTLAVPLIAAAIVFDVLDGRVARLTGTTSEFGAQLDSLADLVSFGVAPAVLAYEWGLQPLGWLGWAAGFLFLTAAALRLAKFNVSPARDRRYFSGLPSPGAAATIAATVLAVPHGLHSFDQALAALLVVLLPAGLMVSTVRFRTFKTVDLGARPTYQWILVLVALLLALALWPRNVFILLAYGYLLSGPIDEIRLHLRPESLEPHSA